MRPVAALSWQTQLSAQLQVEIILFLPEGLYANTN